MDRRVVLIIILALAATVVFYRPQGKDFCQTDSDCVPKQCCHPYSCININYKPDCTGTICTQVCEGSIDCGVGYCGCIANKCAVIPIK